jgi:phosphatidate cytidylyltransferase
LSPVTHERLFGWEHAFDHPVTIGAVIGIAVVLVSAPFVIGLLVGLGKIGDPLRLELRRRYRSWLVLVPLLLAPILLGAAWTVALVLILSLLCYREYARATGLFREKLISLLVVVGIFAVNFAALDHWYNFFMALVPLTIGVIASAAIFADRPKGYIQRVALGVFAFMLFGSSMAHLSFLANDTLYRPMLILILLAVELNDVFAYLVGKPLGRTKLIPNTSPNKTVAGAGGSLVLTTVLVAVLGAAVFEGTPMAWLPHLIALGLIISAVGQLSDLMVSSIKRDLGLKDMGATIPGHGGLLDRFDSLLLVAPCVFHYVKYVNDVGLGQPTRIFTGG